MHIDIEIQVEQLLNIEEQGILANRIAQVTDERVLYLLGHNYNWDDGFTVPKAIISNPNCGLATALVMFYLADGARYLKNKMDVEKSTLEPWCNFIINLYNEIVHGNFKRSNIRFVPPLSKVETYKLKKSLDTSEYVFIEEIGGEDLDKQ